VFHDHVDLTWNASSGATGYTVYRDGTPIATPATTSYSDTDVLPEMTYRYTVDAFNDAGNSARSGEISVTTPSVPTGGGSVVVMAAGDIACDPASTSFKSGNGTSKQCRQKYTANLLSGADRVLALGDTQYDCGGLTAYMASYDKSWGAYKSKTFPAVGDEEYATSGTGCGAAGADGYFNYFGTVAQSPGGYYSYDFGGWHFVVLNSECSRVGGCGEGTPQNNWLEADLAANTETCTLAYWHRPAFASKASGSQTYSTVRPLWDDLYAAGAEIVLTGHSHWYERFKPQTSAGVSTTNGIVEWVVGTGGKSHNTNALAAPGARHPNSVTANASTFGVLKLTLRANDYDWRYLVEGTSSYSDAGTANCH
jgi:acid phosphatase type 7